MLLSKSITLLLLLIITVIPGILYAAPDQYPGDTSIYGATTTMLKPNILIILDNSGSMTGTVCAATGAYDPVITFPNAGYSKNKVYRVVSGSYIGYITNVTSVVTSCGGLNPRNLLQTTGQYSGRGLKSTGVCDGSSTSGVYVLGNYINYLKSGGCAVYKQKIDIAKEVVTNLIQNTNGVNFGILKFNNDEGGTFIKKSVSGSYYYSTVKDMDAIHTGTTTNRQALLSIVSDYTANTWTPLAETLYEAMLYYKGGTKKFGQTGYDASNKYTSPITASCQKNYVILVTDGMSTQDKNTVLGTNIGDYDLDGADPGSFDSDGSHYLDDVAKYLYDEDLFPDGTYPSMQGKQNVTTYTIGFGLGGADADAVALLNSAADSNHGHGQAFLAADQTGLSEALMQVVSNILEINSSFVAPIIPTSPENKTSDASRVYIGLFKPNNTSYWEGNLKKFGLDSYNDLCDKSDLNPSTNPKKCLNYATYMDVVNNTTKLPPADGKDDRDDTVLPTGKTNGAFRDNAISFWSENADAGNVTAGGAGALLQSSNPADRKIFTYFGNANLADNSNRFTVSNTAITTAGLGVADTAARDGLINFVVGYDAYDDNSNGSTTDNRDWILGDILHSRPAVVNYKKYTFSTANESSCSTNKTMIFVGANDGMLHAFRDCDGSEAWAFIPPDTLPNLQLMHSATHTNFLDSSVSAYVYDAPVADGLADTVYLIVGQRRGGGGTVSPAKGYYYLLDASDPENPKFVKSISNVTSGFTELGETWSEPKLAKIKVGTEFKIAAIFGGGYDNLNEDRRYGAATTYPATTVSVNNNDLGAGSVSSVETTTASNPKGRGIYVVEIARLVAGASGYTSDFTNIGSLIWSYVSTSAASFVGEISTVDVKNRGYVDRLYAIDVTGTLWRFNIGALPSTTDTTTWSGLKIFTANTSTDKGKKVFYKPTVVRDYCYTSAAYPTCYSAETCDMVFYGTGDREHPLNKNVVDRIYMVKVKDSDATGDMTESNLVDVTTNLLQTTTTLQTIINSCSKTAGSVEDYLRQLKLGSGWYIKLNELAGEKVLATSAVINKVAYFTTYVPTNSDPCQTTNPGDSYVYALRYNTGEAILNLNTVNDVANATSNTRSQTSGATVLLNRSDRKKGVGQGIASGVVVTTSSTGQVSVFVGAGDKPLTNPGITKSGTKPVKMLNWRLR
jgi:type IV pilus assembly protein PilY1